MAYYNPVGYVPGGSVVGATVQRAAKRPPLVAAPRPATPVAKKPAAAPAAADPFAPMSPAAIQKIIGQFTGMYGTPLTDQQIQSQAQASIDPIIQAITSSETQRAAASTAAIRGLADQYASELGKVNWAAPYQQAQGQQAAVDAALQQQLSGAGSDLASGLKDRLAAIGMNDPAVAQTAGDLSSRGQAMAGTQLAYGSSALSNLIAQAAASGAYGQQLPGIARLTGIQGVGQAQSQATQNIAQGTQSALGQLPSILANLRSGNASLRGNQADTAASLLTTLLGQNVSKATAKAGLAGGQAKLGYDYAKASAEAKAALTRARISQQNANTAAARAQADAAYKAAKLQLDQAKLQQSKKPKARFTASQVQAFKGKALTIAQQAFNGAPAVTDPNDPTKIKLPALKKLSYSAALLEMEKEGVPVEIATQALQRVGYLTPGQKKKQDAAVKSGLGLPSLPFAPGAPIFGGGR